MISSIDEFHETMDSFNFTYFEKKDIKLTTLVGSGYIGEVYEGIMKLGESSISCIVKKVSSNSYDLGIDDRYFYDDIIHEVEIFTKIPATSNHLIRFYGYSSNVQMNKIDLYIVMEKTKATGDIQSYIYNEEFWIRLTKEEYDTTNSNTTLSHNETYYDYIMSYKDKLQLCYQICLAIQELHSFHIVHTDIKPQNMLYTGTKVILIDFNASIKMDPTCDIVIGKREQGTPGYMAKEMYKGDISYKADIYALGVTMLEVWFGDIWPHLTDRYDKNRRYVLDYLSLLKDDNPNLHSLIKQCISVKRKSRPDINDIVKEMKELSY